MKLTTRDIGPFLDKRPTAPVILIYGPDHGLIAERARILGQYIVSDLNDAFNTATLTGDQVAGDPARFFDETAAISMLGGDRLIRVQNATDGLTGTLKTYLQSPHPGTWVILTADDLSPKSTLRKLAEADKNAVALPCYIEDAANLTKLIAAKTRDAGLRIDPDALNFLATAIAGDHQQVKSEIDKLLTYMGVAANGQGTGAITLNDAQACSGAMGLAQLDAFIDAFLTGDVNTAFTLLPRLEDDGVNMIVLLRSLMSHGRKLHATHIRLTAGENLSDILESRDAPVFFKRKTAFGQQIRLWPQARLQKLLHDLLALEVKMKTGEPDVILTQGLLSLAARARRAG